SEIIEYIINYNTPHPITVCRADGYIQQLAGKYSKSLIPKIDALLNIEEEETRDSNQKKRKCKVHSLLDLVGAEIIEAKELDFYSEGIFLNMNRQADYQIILSKFNLLPK
ncbi:MAG: hypothetical protein KAI45_02290, partial [Melioribacteraceae bacterium]|nr:hypothetical protein [Melioribacteraceae bacterium]